MTIYNQLLDKKCMIKEKNNCKMKKDGSGYDDSGQELEGANVCREKYH